MNTLNPLDSNFTDEELRTGEVEKHVQVNIAGKWRCWDSN